MRKLLVTYFIRATLTLHVLASQGDNAEEFRVLCRLIHLAEYKIPDLPKDLKTTASDAGLEKVYALTNLTSLNESERETRLAEMDPTLRAWLKVIGPERWTNPPHLVVNQIGWLKQEAEKIEAALKKTRGKFEAARDQAQKFLAQTLYGTLVTQNKADEIQKIIENPTSMLTGEPAKAAVFVATETAADSCGGAEDGEKEAGKTLINDFFCVCVSDNTGKDNKVCHEGVTYGTAWGQTAASATNFPESWTAVRSHCPQAHLATSPEAIASALSTFRGLLGRDTSAAKMAKKQVLGKAQGDLASNACGDGTAKTCVFYKKALGAGGIPWENNFLNAKKKLEEMLGEKLTLESLMRDQHHLSMMTDMIAQQFAHYPTESNSSKGPDKRARGNNLASDTQIPADQPPASVQNSTVFYTKLSAITAAAIYILA